MLAVLHIQKGRYYADPRGYWARIQRQHLLQGRNLADWDERLALNSWCNELAHPEVADTLADVASRRR